jgi:hypothetical protein
VHEKSPVRPEPTSELAAQNRSRVAADTGSLHTPTMTLKECSIAGTDRNDSGNGSFSVDISFQLRQCPARIGSSGNAVLVVYLCVCLFQRGGVLLCVPQSAIVILPRA